MRRRITVRTYLGRPLVTTAAALAVAAAGVAVTATAATATPGRTAAAAGSVQLAATAPTCPASALHLQAVGTDTAVGMTAMTIAVTNRSAATCSLAGYPTIRLVQANGHAIAAVVSPGTGPVFGSAAGQTAVLAPGGKASFFFVYRDFRPATGQPCAPSSEVAVQLPDVTGQFTVAAELAACGPISVSDLRSGAAKE